jgi:hypothetical protein
MHEFAKRIGEGGLAKRWVAFVFRSPVQTLTAFNSQ